MKTRRYSISKSEGETIVLALVSLIDQCEKLSERYDADDSYWKYLQAKAEMLKSNLTNYKWTKE